MLGVFLPKGGLLPFLQRFPQYFQVTLAGEMTTGIDNFTMLPAINEVTATAGPAVGDTTHGTTAGPAVDSKDVWQRTRLNAKLL